MNPNFRRILAAASFFAGLFCCCASADAQQAGIDFLALGDGKQPEYIPIDGSQDPVDQSPRNFGQQASIIHVDKQGHVTIEPIDFLKGRALLGWDAVGLDEVMTCESTAHSDELEFKYYEHKILKQTFLAPTIDDKIAMRTSPWMLLLPENNYLFVDLWRMQDGLPAIVLMRFNLKTGVQTEVKISTVAEKEQKLNEFLAPVWDSKRKSLIFCCVHPASASGNRWFIGHLDPDTFALTDKVALAANTQISALLDYDAARDSVIFRGQCGGILTHGGVEGIYELSLLTGDVKLLLTEQPAFDVPSSMGKALLKEMTGGKSEMPGHPMVTTNYLAILNLQYVVMMRAADERRIGDYKDPHAFLIDLDKNDWQMLTGITYITWPISQKGLNVTPASSNVSPTKLPK